MQKAIDLHLFGSLRKYANACGTVDGRIDSESPVVLGDLLRRFGIPAGEIQIVMVNHRAVGGAVTIQPGDRLALFPREYPFFVDWKDMRHPPC